MDKALLRMPIMETERLILRPVNIKDVNDMYEYGTDKEVTKYLLWKPYEKIMDAYWSIENIFYKRLDNNLPEAYALVLKSENKMIGMCDFVSMNEKSRCAEIGYVLNRHYWGKGLMVEACKELIKLGFERFHLVRIQIAHITDNYQSQRVIEKLGFVYEGIKRKGVIKWDGSIYNIKTYSIIDDDYFQKSLPWQKKELI